MKNKKKLLHPLYFIKSYYQLVKSYYRFPRNSTILIHIGKCGGSSVIKGIRNKRQDLNIYPIHLERAIYRKDLKYIIIARSPASRLASAFQWRYKLVVLDEVQKDRFKDEYDVLIKYGSLNNLAEALYHKDGTVNNIAQQEIRKIHHIREDISFHLHELLNKCHSSQIVAVLMQENLDHDILRVFGYENELQVHKNPLNDKKYEESLSEVGFSNLMKFLSQDYEMLMKLYCWGKIKREVFIRIM